MWLAVSACGGAPGWTTTSPKHKVSILEVPLLANASYVATVAQGDFGNPGPQVSELKGTLRCDRVLALFGRTAMDPDLVDAQRSCSLDIAELLRAQGGFLFIIDGAGKRWMSAAEIIAAIAPIDTPEKAALAVFVSGHQLDWTSGGQGYGGPFDSMVHPVTGGFEVASGDSKTDSDCGNKGRETVTNYRLTVFVDARGAVTVRGKTKTGSYDIADPCHPAGRRPADFVALASGGTVEGLLRRAMHDEAESVRAFERIARELRAHDAPAELIAAAEQAAIDERDHAARCAALIGETAVIASDALPVRSLRELAIDNAREGCVGESYASLAAVVQAQAAESAELRAHFAAIATDELAHAALAHAIAEWIDGVLSPTDRALVAATRGAAARELAASFDAPASPAMRELGMPTGATAHRLLAALTGA